MRVSAGTRGLFLAPPRSGIPRQRQTVRVLNYIIFGMSRLLSLIMRLCAMSLILSRCTSTNGLSTVVGFHPEHRFVLAHVVKDNSDPRRRARCATAARVHK